jgi:hypothetical protein
MNELQREYLEIGKRDGFDAVNARLSDLLEMVTSRGVPATKEEAMKALRGDSQ